MGRERLLGYHGQLVVAEVQVDQRVELGEASQVVQLVPGQVQGLDVAQVGVCRFQEPQQVVGQIHMDQVVQVLQAHQGSKCSMLDQAKEILNQKTL